MMSNNRCKEVNYTFIEKLKIVSEITHLPLLVSSHTNTDTHTHTHRNTLYMCVCVCVCVYVYIYIYSLHIHCNRMVYSSVYPSIQSVVLHNIHTNRVNDESMLLSSQCLDKANACDCYSVCVCVCVCFVK